MRKIYRKIVIDLKTNETLLEDSYLYDGPVDECKGYGGEFQNQTTGSYRNVERATASMDATASQFLSMAQDRFGRQSRTYDLLDQGIRDATATGPASFNYDNKYGGLGGGQGAGTGSGGSGGGGSRGEGSGSGAAFDYGYNEGILKEPEWDRLETIMRTESSEDVSARFNDAAKAFGSKSLQLGGYAPSLENAALRELYEGQAISEATGQRDVLKFIEGGKIDYSKLLNQLKEDMYTKAAANKVADMASKRATGAARSSARAALAQQAAMFQQQMLFNYKQAQDDQFFRGLGLAGNVAGLQQGDWQGAGQIGAGLQGDTADIWSKMYGIGSQGAATTNTSWGGLLGGILSGAAKFGLAALNPAAGATSVLSGLGGNGLDFLSNIPSGNPFNMPLPGLGG